METVSRRIEHMQLGVTYSKEIFKKMEGQREIKESNVETLMNSIVSNKGLIQPVVVDKQKRIIDGGHRVESIHRLNKDGHNFPILYIINNVVEPRGMMHSNIKKEDWKLNNFLDFQSAQGDKTCQRVLELIKEYGHFGFAPGVVADIMNSSLSKTAIKSLELEEYTINESRGRKILDICRVIGEANLIQTDERKPHTLARFVKGVRRVVAMNDTSFEMDRFMDRARHTPLYLYQKQSDNAERIAMIYNKGERKKINRIRI